MTNTKQAAGQRHQERLRRRLLAFVLAACALTAPHDLPAEGLRARADRAFREGYSRYSTRDYQGALQKFFQARKLYPSYKIDLNIGYTLDAMGRTAEAAGYFELFLAVAKAAAEQPIVKGVRERLAELRQGLTRVTVDCSSRGAVVLVDARRAGRTPLAHPLYLVPGGHRVKVVHQGEVLFEREITMARGGHTFLSIPRPVVTRPAASAPAVAPRAPAPRARPFFKKWWFWTVVGVVVVGGVVGGVVASQTGGSEWLPAGDSGSVRLY